MQSTLLQKITRAAFVVALCGVGTLPAVAWTGPSTAPPGGNTATPVNVSSTAQSKAAPLNISLPSGYDTWGINVSGGNYGVLAQASAGPGVEGTSASNWAGEFIGAYGVYGQSTASWAGEFINQSGSAPYGVYSQNGLGYWTELDNGSYGVLTNGDVCINGGKCLSSVPAGYPFGGGFSEYLGGGCVDPNIAAGWICGCPASAPNAQGLSNGTYGGSAYNTYLCY